MAYLEGNLVQFDVSFLNPTNDAAVDPTTVTFSYQINGGAYSNPITYTVATVPSVGVIARLAAGSYATQLNTSGISGIVTGLWVATGTGAASVTDTITVGTSQPLLFGDLIENVFRRAVGPVTQRIVTINQANSIGADDDSFTFAGAQSGAVKPGQKLSVELEDMLVLSVTGQVATVSRGYNGSTPASHATSALVYVNSRITRFDVGVAINDDLNDLSAQGLYRVGVAQLSWIPVFYGYDLGGLPTNYIDILGVESRTIDPYRRFPSTKSFDTRRWNVGVTDPAFPSGNALIVDEIGDPGQPIYVTYAAPFIPLVAVGDGVVNTPAVNDQAAPPNGYTGATVPNLALTMLDIPPLGATAALIQPGEIGRNDMGPMPDSAKAVDVPAQAIATATNPLLVRRAQRISAEADRLYVAYPNRR